MKEPGEHLATRESREEIMFVTFEDGRSFVPEVFAVEQNVVDGVSVTAVRTSSVVVCVLPEAGRVHRVKCVSCNYLKGGRLIGL